MISYKPFFETIKEKGISQYSLIHKYGISASVISSLRQGKNLSMATIDRLCTVLDCDVTDIMTFEKTSVNKLRVYSAPSGEYMDKARYDFIAEFNDEEVVKDFIRTIREKKKYPDRDIVITEYVPDKPDTEEFKAAVPVTGECICV